MMTVTSEQVWHFEMLVVTYITHYNLPENREVRVIRVTPERLIDIAIQSTHYLNNNQLKR